MSTLTTRLNMVKAASSENVNVTTHINNNLDILDSYALTTTGASASRPASAVNGRMYYATDSNKLYVNEAANASTVASWSDPVADGFASIVNLTISGSATIATGLTVTAGKGSKSYVRKSATESLASSTTMQNDDHITFSLAASAVYELRAYLAVTGPAAGDFKTQWNISGAASGGNHTTRFGVGPSSGVSDVTGDAQVAARRQTWGTSMTYGTDGTNTSHIHEGGLLDTTTGGTGTITLQWAQNTSNASSTTVTTASYAILERLA